MTWQWVLGTIALILLVAWLFCLIPGIPAPPWCPCAIGCGGSGDETLPTDELPEVCDDIAETMNQEIPIITTVARTLFTAAGGEWVEGPKMMGVIDSLGRIPCRELALNTTFYPALGMTVQQGYDLYESTCESKIPGAIFECTPTYFLCYCPGSTKLPGYDCGWTDQDGLRCDGSCDEGRCQQSGIECECIADDQPPEDTLLCENMDPLVCGLGTCSEQGQTCVPNIIMTGCSCQYPL
jgi:hypothetical protein